MKDCREDRVKERVSSPLRGVYAPGLRWGWKRYKEDFYSLTLTLSRKGRGKFDNTRDKLRR